MIAEKAKNMLRAEAADIDWAREPIKKMKASGDSMMTQRSGEVKIA